MALFGSCQKVHSHLVVFNLIHYILLFYYLRIIIINLSMFGNVVLITLFIFFRNTCGCKSM